MNTQRLVGVLLLIVGVVLLIIGITASQSLGDRFSAFFTGEFTDGTVWSIVGGAVSAIAGVAMLVFGGRVTTA